MAGNFLSRNHASASDKSSGVLQQLKCALEGTVTGPDVDDEDIQLIALIDNYENTSLSTPVRLEFRANLASELWRRWEQTHSELIILAYMNISSEILEMHPRGHPDRASACHNLSLALATQFQRTGDAALLDEAITLSAEALILRPVGHPDRSSMCNNLAVSLLKRYEQTGETAMLDKAVQLNREALGLRPPGHPDRATSCNNLATSLETRFAQSGETVLLDAAIELEREALALRRHDHPERAASCINLAGSLQTRFQQTGDIAILEEAVSLGRQSLELRSSVHPGRAMSCRNLANSLWMSFEATGRPLLREESISLRREALDLCAHDHPDRAMLYNDLGASLISCLGQLHPEQVDESAIQGVHQLLQKSQTLLSMTDPQRWWSFDRLARLGLLQHDVQAVLDNLHTVLTSSSYDNIHAVLRNTTSIISEIDVRELNRHQKATLLNLYELVISLMGVAAISGLAPTTQLQNIRSGQILGSGAFRLAIDLDSLPAGIKLLEHTRGIIWSQLLHMRNPQLDNVPPELSEALLCLLHSADPSKRDRDDWISSVAARDQLYAERGQIRDIMGQIRSIPGLHDFMQGPDAHMMMNAAARSFIAVLVASETECRVLVIASVDGPMTSIHIPDMNQLMLRHLTLMNIASQKRGVAFESTGDDRFMTGVRNRMLQPQACLADVWRAVVRPIISHLGLTASETAR
jgi:hypothetical protein